MIASFYFFPTSFSNNNQLTLKELDDKVGKLLKDVLNINKYKATNKIYVNYQEVYSVEFYKGITLNNVLERSSKVNVILDRDLKNKVISLFSKVESTNYNCKDIVGLTALHDENSCNGVIAFNKIDSVNEENQVVYGINDWIKFRRYFLGLYPKDEVFFIEECRKYFPNLFIHERNKTAIKDIFKDFHKSVVKHLGFLNDVFYTYRHRCFDNESIKYKTFTSDCKLEEDAASKDNNSSKDRLTFEFENKNGLKEKVTCFPHLRLCKSDISGDNTYYKNRIYFHEGLDSISDKNILIGHIGEHR
ncbi:MAG: hypothetical protein QM534_17835 [Sediminibacterium sp.]|nr:hypothetical protein [Sediminibacterium sp.]